MRAFPLGEVAGVARRAAGLPSFLRRPLDRRTAASEVARRCAGREAAFLEVAARLLDGPARHPLARLLTWAGCALADLERLAHADGLDAALGRLHAAGVRVSDDERRGRVPLRRPGLELELAPHAFANPLVRASIHGSTSGSTGPRIPVTYSWEFLGEEAADELLLLASHDLIDAALALWLPAPPGIAGVHNLLVHAKLGRPPERWFSPSARPGGDDPLAAWADRGWRLLRRLTPRLGPAAEWVTLEQAEQVARWLATARRPAVLKCFASSALRVAAAAAAAGLDLSGQVILAGGEPLSKERREVLARAGLRVFGRYAATETGFVGAACPSCVGDELHLYADRLAVIAGAGVGAAPLAFTTLSLAAPQLLLNVELGDWGELRRKSCDCALGQAGLSWRVAGVHNPAKIAAEGVKLGELDFMQLVEDAVRALGGGPDDFQIWMGDTADGAPSFTLALTPESVVTPAGLREHLRRQLPALAGGGALAAALWIDAGALAIRRRPLLPGPGGKMRRLVRADHDDADRAAPPGHAL